MRLLRTLLVVSVLSAALFLGHLAVASQSALAVILYDQYNNYGNDAITSTNYSSTPSYNSEAADDFVVPAGQTWTITQVDFHGYLGEPCTGTFNVTFYTNASGLPGTVVASRPSQTLAGTNPNYSVTLTSAVVLSAGTYWVSIQSNQAANTWFWGMRTAGSIAGFQAAWREAGGIGTGCTNWGNRGTCTGTSGFGDQMFRLNGTTGATAVSFRGLSARPSPAGIAVSWRTASELDIVGFSVYHEANGKRVRINAKLIQGKGRGVYTFLDRKAPNGKSVRYCKSVRYWIQAVNLDGSRSWYGPARVVRRS